jgi:signal transduction histidine kinase
MSPGSLRLRLLAVGGVSVSLALMLSAAGLVFLFERHVERRVDAELTVHLNQLVAGLERDQAGNIALINSPAEPRFERPLSGLYWQIVVEPSGPILMSRSLWDVELLLPQDAPSSSELRRYRLAGPGGAMLHLVERRFELPARLGGVSIRAAVGLDTAEIHQAVDGLARDLVPFLGLIAALLLTAAWAQVTVGLLPLTAVRERLTAIRSGNEQRLGSGFPDEVKPLAVEIDALLDARDVQIDKARARAADLAHGLKTPLQVLASEAEHLEKKGEREIAAELTSIATAMHRHVERALMRARLAAGAFHTRAEVRTVAERVINVVRRTPTGRQLTWSIDVSGDLFARIDADDLAEVLGNLLENAARHARSCVGISGRRERDHVLVRITDDGPGIPAERVAEALARGVRLDASSSGAGLGLAIVSDIAETWGASFCFEHGGPGTKANLRLRLP